MHALLLTRKRPVPQSTHPQAGLDAQAPPQRRQQHLSQVRHGRRHGRVRAAAQVQLRIARRVAPRGQQQARQRRLRMHGRG